MNMEQSVDEAIEELQGEDVEGFYLVTSDGEGFDEVWHNIEPDDWEYETNHASVSRQLLLGYGLHSLQQESEYDEVTIGALVVRVMQFFEEEFGVEEVQ